MADEEDLHAGPLSDRVAHKNWKVRRAAFEELQQKFKEATDNAIFEEYAPKFKKIVEDKNAAAQEKGLDALLSWIDRAENPTKLSSLAQALATNCFGGRANTVQKAIEALLLFIEVDKSGEAVITSLLPECFNKQWKISSATISTITLALKTFGSKVVPLKPILKEVAKMFDDSNPKVREEAQNLVVEMYRWAGAGIKPTVDTLRPVQITALNAAFDALPKTKAVPEKYLRCEQPQDDDDENRPSATTSGSTGGGDDEDEGSGGMDAYDLAEPVDVLSKIPADWYDKVASPKWKERNEQMDILLGVLNVVRMQPGDYKELTRTLKKIIDKDANVGVVAKAAQASTQLAKGLRQNYSSDARMLVSTLLAKFKEKKANVVTALHEALDSMMETCFSLPDLAEDITAALDAKTPPAREQTLVFVTRFIIRSKRAAAGQAIKFLGPLFLKAMDDGTPEVREAAYKAFGTLVGKVGERPLSPYLSKLDGIKEKKVKENYPEKIFTGTLNPQAAKPTSATNEKAPAKKPVGNNSKTSTTAQPALKRAPVGAKPTTTAQGPKPVTQEAKAPLPEKQPTAAVVAPTVPAKQGTAILPQSAPKPAASKPKPAFPAELPLISPEEALERAKTLLPETFFQSIEDASTWKNRVAGMDELITFLDKLLEKDEALNVQVILRLIEQKPGFKDPVMQVMQRILQTVTRLAKSQFFTKSMAELVISTLVDKIADIKLRNFATECLNGIVEAVGLDFILKEVYKHANDNKNPKAAIEVLGWISAAIEDFGIAGPPTPVDIKALVEFAKGPLDHNTSTVRSAATKTLTKVFTFVGESIKEHLGDVKPALMATIDKEFAKYANAKPEQPTKFYRQKIEPAIESESEPQSEPEASVVTEPLPVRSSVASSKPAPPASAADDSWVEGAVDEYDNEEESATPTRVDISPQLTPQLFAELSDAKDWKMRKEALDKIRRILSEANMNVSSSCLAILMPKLNARLKDTNKNLVLYTVKLLGLLATAIGKDIESQLKTTLPLIFANYTDQKQTMRDTVTKTVDQWAAQVGTDALIPYFPAAIAVENSSARKDALSWLVAHKKEIGQSNSSELRVLVKPTITAMQDKITDVRHLSEELLEDLFAKVDVEFIRSIAKEIKQAALKQQIVAIAKKARGTSGSSASTSSNEGSEKPAPSTKNSTSTASSSVNKLRVSANISSASPSTVNSPRRTSSNASGALPRVETRTAPLIPNEDKMKRQRQDDNIVDDVRGWTFKTPRPEHIQHLQQQAKPYLAEALYGRMFSKDYRKHREALQELATIIEQHVEETKQNVDILLKWASIRLFDSNTPTQTKALSFLTRLFEVLDANDYHLTDYEANIILPVLLECLGQGEAMQEGISALLKILPRVYPASKFFNYLLNSGLLGSKSPRTRADCLEQMAALIRKQGLNVCANPSSAFPHIVQFVTDKVAAVRNAALAVIQQAHLHIGDDLWLYTGTLSDTQKALINQKVGSDSPVRPTTPLLQENKRATTEEHKKTRTPSTTPQKTKAVTATTTLASSQKSSLNSSRNSSVNGSRPASAASSRAPSKPPSEDGSSISSFSLELDKLPGAKQQTSSTSTSRVPVLEPTNVPSSVVGPTPSLPSRLISRSLDTTSSTATPLGITTNVVIETWIKDLESGDVEKMIAVCKAILEKLAENNLGFFHGSSDILVKTLASQLNATLRQKDFSVDKNREFKYFVNILFKLFHQAPIAIGIGRDATKFVLKSLMVAFVNPLITRSDADTSNNLYKGIQMATMKVLRNTDQTAIFTTLLELLDETFTEMPSGQTQSFAEVLIKALAIVIQHLKETINDITIDQVLYDLNNFLESHHTKRPDDDMSSINTKLRLETVRLCHTAIKEIVSIKGRAGVCRHLSLIPVSKYPTPVVIRVINKVLKELFGASSEAITADEVPQEEQLQEEDEQLAAKNELKQIMQRLSTTERQSAIKDLYRFKTQHPNIDIQPYLATSSTQFQSYVRRALMAVEEKENVPVVLDTNTTVSTASEDVYMDKLRALQKRYGHTVAKTSAGSSLVSSIDTTSAATVKPVPSSGTSIQDLRLRLNAIRPSSGDAASGETATLPTTPSASSTLDSAAAVQQLKARLARIKQASNAP